jgi:hypothetical protein
MFEEENKKTPVAIRFSTVGGKVLIALMVLMTKNSNQPI